MNNNSRTFEFDYYPGTIKFGRGSVEGIEEIFQAHDLNRALIVCGSNVGSNNSVMDPVIKGLGDTFQGVFDETTPAKHIRTAHKGVLRMQEDEIDALVPIGGGSSLDVAKVMSLIAAHAKSFDELLEIVKDTGRVPAPQESASVTPSVVVPSTLAGADMSTGGGIKLLAEPEGEPPLDDEVRSARFSDPRLTPLALFYDPELFETTPRSVLKGSAMNGFNKGIETIYSGSTTPITDATAIHGLRTLRTSLPILNASVSPGDKIDQIVEGIILVQYGRQTSIIHSFGHGLSFYYPIQQGEAHGVMAPHVLRYVFENIGARRDLIGEGLGVDPDGVSDEALATAIVENVIELRDLLGLPSQLREFEALEHDHIPAIAKSIYLDPNMQRNPSGLEPTVGEIENVLENAW